MKKSLRYFFASLLCAMTVGANAQTTIFSWKYDASTTAFDATINGTGGSVKLKTNDTSKEWKNESAKYNEAVTDEDLKGPAKGLKFGANALYLEVTLDQALATGDIIYVCGYNSIAFSTEEFGNNASNGNISTGVTTGNDKTDYNVGQVVVPADADGATTLYVMRTNSSSTCLAAIKIVRPASADKENVTITFPEDSYEVDINDVETFEAPTATVDPSTISVVYSSSNESVATVDPETGAVDILGELGTTTITASFAGDDTYNSASASYTLSVVPGAMLIDYPNTKDGITASGTTAEGSVKIHTNTDIVTGYQLKNGYTTNGVLNENYIKLSVEGGFKKGDVLNIIGVYNNSDEKNANITLFTTEDEESYTIIYDKFNDFINGKLVADDPVMQSYTLEADYNDLYIGRKGNTTTVLTLIQVVRPKPTSVAVTISESTYATFYYAEKEVQIPDGITAYTVGINSEAFLNELEGVYIPAGVPVVLKGAAGDYEFTVTSTDATFEGTNNLTGSEEGGTFGNDGAKYYVLCWKNSNKNIDEVGFYYLSGSKGKYATVKAHQAYLRVEASQANEAGYAFNGETTGISTVETAADSSDAPMYNLAGQRVNGSYRGVVIQDGKKVRK